MAVWALKEKRAETTLHTPRSEKEREVCGASGAGAETKTINSKSYVNQLPKWTQICEALNVTKNSIKKFKNSYVTVQKYHN